MILRAESSKELCLFETSFFGLFENIVEIRRITDIDKHPIVASVLFKTQLVHETRHFVQSSLIFHRSIFLRFKIFLGGP